MIVAPRERRPSRVPTRLVIVQVVCPSLSSLLTGISKHVASYSNSGCNMHVLTTVNARRTVWFAPFALVL